MKIAAVSTNDGSLRSEIFGRTYEDSDLLVNRSVTPNKRISIGLTPSPKDIPNYCCVLEMINEGWKLLGPPTRFGDNDETYWDWWLTK